MKHIPIVVFLFWFFEGMWALAPAGAGPVSLTDVQRNVLVFHRVPERVACLAPHIAQILKDLGQAGRIAALTRQDLVYHAGIRAVNAGSYFSPDIAALEGSRPDLIICTPSQAGKIRAGLSLEIPVMVMAAASMDQAFNQVRDLGRLFGCEAKAAGVLEDIRTRLDMVAGRLAAEEEKNKTFEKKRVVRVMGGSTLTCPGDESFQNQMIRAAGGQVPVWGKKGAAVVPDPEDFCAFKPQIIYGCTANAARVRGLLVSQAFAGVEAVQQGRIHFFPCELTCRVTTRTGDFVQWLAAVIYPEVFGDPERALTPDKPLYWQDLSQDLARDQIPDQALNQDWVASARVVGHRLADTPYKSLVIRFKTPRPSCPPLKA